MPDRKSEEKLDDMLDDTFPASDPPSTTPSGGTRKSREIAEAHDSKPTSTPNHDRHATETAGARQEGSDPSKAGAPSDEH